MTRAPTPSQPSAVARPLRVAGRIAGVPIVAAALLSASCHRAPERPPAGWERQLDLDDPTRWVTLLDPARASPGFTLDLLWRRIPILVALDGRIVHAWPEARVRSRARLLPDGSLLAIARGRGVVEHAWDGAEVWRYNAGEDLPHHDLVRLANGNTMIIVRRDGEVTDDLLEVDRAGGTVWRWRSAEHLAPWALERGIERDDGDLTHLNSVQELPANRWHQAGDSRFRPGNLLISARNLDAVFVVDRQSGEIAWSYSHRLDRQHEALMVPPGMPGAGSVMLLDNGTRGRYRDRQSRVVAIDPTRGSVDWEYGSETFFTPTSGVEQPLPNGNVLITSTRGGRVFEVTRDGDLVWEWLPPTQPVRAHRYPADHAPQLAALASGRPAAVRPPDGYRWVDPRVHQFARRGAVDVRVVAGERRRVLKRPQACRELLLPWRAGILLDYGFATPVDGSDGSDGGAASPVGEGRNADPPARAAEATRGGMEVVVRVGREEGGLLEVHRDRMELGDGQPVRRWIGDLERWELSRTTVCVALEPVGERDLPSSAFVTAPVIGPAVAIGGKLPLGAAGWEPDGDDDDDGDGVGLTDDEREAERRHLEALGYID